MSDRALLASICGADAVRDPDPLTDRISSILPPLVVEPGTPAGVAAVLGWASQERRTVVIRGCGSRMAWGRIPADVDLLLSMRRLDRIVAHESGDLTATVEASVPLLALNEALAQHGQCLPIDPPDRPGATIGGRSPPTRAARCGIGTARRAISSSASRSPQRLACSRRPAVALSRTSPATTCRSS